MYETISFFWLVLIVNSELSDSLTSNFVYGSKLFLKGKAERLLACVFKLGGVLATRGSRSVATFAHTRVIP